MRLCPAFFDNIETINDILSKPLTSTGWCTPPPHTLVKFMTAGHTILHEMTHLSFIGTHALGEPESEE